MNILDLDNEVKAVMTLVGHHAKPQALLAALLRPEHFKDPRTKEAYTRVMAMAKTRKELPTYDTMKIDTLLSTEARELLDPDTYPPCKKEGDAEQLLSVLEKMRQSRSIYDMTSQVWDLMSKEEGVDPEDAFEIIEAGLLDARSDNADEVLDISADGNFLELTQALLARNKPNTIPTGFHEFDAKTGGLPRAGLTTLAASSGGGKSCMANQLVINAFKAGYSCAIVTLEMSRDQTLGRILSNLSGVDYTLFTLAETHENQKQVINREAAKFHKLCETEKNEIKIFHRSNMTFTQIATEMKALGFDLVVVDYINLLSTADSRSDNPATQLGEIAKEAKTQASATNTAWVMLAQLNEQGDVKYSRAIKENSDYMLKWVYGDAERESNLIEVDVPKARHSQNFKFQLRANFRCQQFQNLGTSEVNADVKIKKGKRKKKLEHPTAAPMPGTKPSLAFEDDDDDL